jgi:Helix-hairpin-helix motif
MVIGEVLNRLVPGSAVPRATVGKFLQARKSYGAFKSVDDLQAIKGIEPKKLDKMRKYLSVGQPPQNAKATLPKTPPLGKPANKSA